MEYNRSTALLARAYFFVAALGALTGGCGAPERDEREVHVVHQIGYEERWQMFLGAARQLPNGTYRVEADLKFPSKDALREYFDRAMHVEVEKAHVFHHISDNFIPKFSFPGNVDLKYCISNDFPATATSTFPDRATLIRLVADATHAWEAAANVRFRYTPENDAACAQDNVAVDFAVMRFDDDGGYCAANKVNHVGDGACFPYGNGVVLLDTHYDVTQGGAVPNVTVTGAIRHELGHILGLRHEHPWRPVVDSTCPEVISDGYNDGLQLTNVAYDRESVMHYPFNGPVFDNERGVWKTDNCGGDPMSAMQLTVVDGWSAQALYGMHPAWMTTLTM